MSLLVRRTQCLFGRDGHLPGIVFILLYCDVIYWLSVCVYIESMEGQAAGYIWEGFSAVNVRTSPRWGQVHFHRTHPLPIAAQIKDGGRELCFRLLPFLASSSTPLLLLLHLLPSFCDIRSQFLQASSVDERPMAPKKSSRPSTLGWDCGYTHCCTTQTHLGDGVVAMKKPGASSGLCAFPHCSPRPVVFSAA